MPKDEALRVRKAKPGKNGQYEIKEKHLFAFGRLDFSKDGRLESFSYVDREIQYSAIRDSFLARYGEPVAESVGGATMLVPKGSYVATGRTAWRDGACGAAMYIEQQDGTAQAFTVVTWTYAFVNLTTSDVLDLEFFGGEAPHPCTEEDLAPYAHGGTATIRGQAFSKTRGGDVKVAAGNKVRLRPALPFWKQWFAQLGDGSVQPIPRGACTKVVREVTADGDGRFRFENLPAGDYLLDSEVRWEVALHGPTGGIVKATAHVDEGAAVDVVVTD